MSATMARFALVGVINTAIGFALILLGLRLGLSDFAANALGYGLGFCVSYALNRWITFKVEGAPSFREFGRFGAAFLLAYAANIAVLGLGRAAGMAGQPMLHLAGLGLYTVLFF
ncbi:MAG: GtrA family protein, partial [Novosphingobium sp.]